MCRTSFAKLNAESPHCGQFKWKKLLNSSHLSLGSLCRRSQVAGLEAGEEHVAEMNVPAEPPVSSVLCPTYGCLPQQSSSVYNSETGQIPWI